MFVFFQISKLCHVQVCQEGFNIKWWHVYKTCSKCKNLEKQMPPLPIKECGENFSN